MNRTYSPKLEEIEHQWFVVDAAGLPLGRLSTAVASILAGKHKPGYARHLDTGDFVIVVNAKETMLTGRKEDQKLYRRHSGRPGKLKEETARHLRSRKPTQLVQLAVRGMLPKSRLGRQQLKKLKIYAGPDHPHQAQQPKTLEIGPPSLMSQQFATHHAPVGRAGQSPASSTAKPVRSPETPAESDSSTAEA